MSGFRQTPMLPARPKRKLFGWYATYNDFIGHPKWRRVSQISGVHLAFVHVIVGALFQSASKAAAKGRKGGWIDDFDFEDCSAASDIPTADVASVVRVLMQIEWISQQRIVDWSDRQPGEEDPTAAERQRNKRARDLAIKAASMGIATREQLALLDKVHLDAVEQIASRVTQPSPPPPVENVTAFTLIPPANDTPEASQAAARFNHEQATLWLLGDGSNYGIGYGYASRIVAENMGVKRLSADQSIRRWLRDLTNDAVRLALIISAADNEALTGDNFKAVVGQRIEATITEQTNGPSLQFGPIRRSITGGK